MAQRTSTKDNGGKASVPMRAEEGQATMPSAWDPFFPLRGRWNRMFDEFMREMPSFPALAEFPALADWSRGGFPSLDVREQEKVVVVRAEVPGVAAADLDVNLAGKMLTIQGEKKQEKQDGEGDAHRVERYFGSFRRQVMLPCEVDPETVKAEFEDGVLTLTLPKQPGSEAHKIPIR